jgi:hypothetical protein
MITGFLLMVREQLKTCGKIFSSLWKKIKSKLRNNREEAQEEPFRCPCCGYAPCDCDDH